MTNKHRNLRTQTVLLDANVWNFLADYVTAKVIADAAKKGNITIMVAPSTVYEAIALKDAAKLRIRSRLLSDDRWHRLMPEAYLEIQELVGEVKNVRPNWLLQSPPKAQSQRLYQDWRRNGTGFWARLRDKPEKEAEYVQKLQSANLSLARNASKEVRDDMAKNGTHNPRAPLSSYVAEVGANSLEDKEKVSVEPWRLDSFDFWTRHFEEISGQPSPLDGTDGYTDWLSGYIDFSAVKSDSVSWYKFWFFEARTLSMRRSWLRWASTTLQAYSKWTNGTPGDAQLSTYVIDAHFLITADRGFYNIAKRLANDANFPVATPKLVSADKPGAEETINLIERGFN